ncbi:MAG: xanthine dehydrogenase family protein molybdopterin-binding subunit [Deltaproteobacteria bacterium]|nr:xanthine dehydrogenase family protein molybdopterin-binding subunit [Deltaproteobacteria bacterium]
MTKDRYVDSGQKNALSSLPMNRREFLKGMGILGGGIVVYFSLGDPSSLAITKRRGPLFARTPTDFNAFLRIGEDGRATLFTGKIEMGQGIITSVAQIMAEELDLPYDSVDMVMGDTDLCPWDMGTWGSLTIRSAGPVFREAAAEARAVLIELAAESLKVPKERLKTRDGVIFDSARKENRVTYAQLAKGKSIERQLKGSPVLKKVSEYKIVGKSFPQRDALEKVTGKAEYAGDIRLPGMLYARILMPPAHGATLKEVDTSGVNIKGAQVVKDGDLIAVLHRYPDEADKALEMVKARFELPKTGLDDKNVFDHLVLVAPKGRKVSKEGDLKKGEGLSSHLFEETYLSGYVTHATMETHTAVARLEGDRVTVWAATQMPFGCQANVASALGMKPKNVRVITPPVGGGFGGKGNNPEAVEAARLAKLTGKPVQVARNRAEDIFYDSFRPAAVVKIRSGLNDAGKIMLWDYDVFFAGEDGSLLFYEVPHHQVLSRGGWMRALPGSHPFSIGPWRAPATSNNTFARESHIDIMASKAGKDPVEFRLQNLSDKKMRRVLKAAAEKFGWTPSKTPSARGCGVACSIRSGSYVAIMAEIDVDKETGKVQVKRVAHAQDMGQVVNPDGAKKQIEGCINMGLGYALTEEIHFKDGEIFDLNFETYEIPRFSWMPEIETVLIDAQDSPPHGGGEPAIVCMGAVIANAIYDAIGVRLFQLPMTPERIKEAIKNSKA